MAAIDPTILLKLYSLAVGFAAAGLCASTTALITGQPLRFEMPVGQNTLSVALGAIARIIAGPFLLLRNTYRALMIKGREPYWVMMSIIIACFWSFCQGVLIVETACSISACSG